MTNNKTSKELLSELVESYSNSYSNAETNKECLDGINKILDTIDNGSIFRYTLNEISFCGKAGQNKVMVVLNGATGPFTKKEKFSIIMYENGVSVIISNYCHRDFNFELDNMHHDVICNIITFNQEVSDMKNQMAAIFENIEPGVKNILDGTELQIKWCDTANSKLMIADKDGENFFLIKGECINNNGKIEIVGKACTSFDWEPTKKAYEQKGNWDVINLFMATNDVCQKIIANK